MRASRSPSWRVLRRWRAAAPAASAPRGRAERAAGLAATIVVGPDRDRPGDAGPGRDRRFRSRTTSIRGRGGDDVICGGAGIDSLDGQRGDDRVYGGPDRDVPGVAAGQRRAAWRLRGRRPALVLRASRCASTAAPGPTPCWPASPTSRGTSSHAGGDLDALVLTLWRVGSARRDPPRSRHDHPRGSRDRSLPRHRVPQRGRAVAPRVLRDRRARLRHRRPGRPAVPRRDVRRSRLRRQPGDPRRRLHRRRCRRRRREGRGRQRHLPARREGARAARGLSVSP